MATTHSGDDDCKDDEHEAKRRAEEEKSRQGEEENRPIMEQTKPMMEHLSSQMFSATMIDMFRLFLQNFAPIMSEIDQVLKSNGTSITTTELMSTSTSVEQIGTSKSFLENVGPMLEELGKVMDVHKTEMSEHLEKIMESSRQFIEQMKPTMDQTEPHIKLLEVLNFYIISMFSRISNNSKQNEEFTRQEDEMMREFEESRRQAEELRLKMMKAFQEGKVSLHLIKCLCQGPPRVGKTHIKHLLLRKVLVDSSSTGCVEDPERILQSISTEKVLEGALSTGSHKQPVYSLRSATSEKYKVADTDKTWEVMDDEKLTLLMAKEMSEMKLEKGDENDEDESIVSKKPVEGLIEKGHAETTIQKVKKSPLQNASSQLPATSRQEWIYFIDSGGQPQFQEILQAFIHNTSILLLAFKLTEKLSDSPLIKYEKSGITYNLGSHALSSKEILIRLAKTICYSKSNMQIALAGTHYDEYVKTDTPSETMEEKEQQLQEIFSFCEDNLIFRDSTFQNIIFPVNGLQAEEGKFDDPIVCELRSSITSTPNPIKIDVPLRWHAFELAIEAEARRIGTHVLSLKRCIEISEDLNFPQDDVIPALTFLSNYNLILYYPSLLPNVVFTTPQVLLDKVTELIERVYQLTELRSHDNSANKPCATRGEYKTMRDRGIISTQILRDFPKHYIPDLFTEAELVKIFQYLYIFAEIENGKIFMPALLPPFTPIELDQLLNLSTPPLLFHFEDSCAPAGLFCALVVCLTSRLTGWKVRHNIKPLNGVKSNAACFVIPGISLVATLVDSFYQFELHYRCSPAHEKHLPKIREVVSEGLEEVIHKRMFPIEIPKRAFFCRSSECIENPSTHRHVATPAIEDKELICSSDPVICYEMNDVESKWLKPPPLDSNAPTMDQLMTELEQVSSTWQNVGVHLLLPPWKLEIIEKNNRGQCYECLMSVLEYWRNSANTKNPFSWKTIVAVLRSKSIGNHRLADEIEYKYLNK